MAVASRVLHQWHREFNAAVFHGELSTPVLRSCVLPTDPAGRLLGLCWSEGERIEIAADLEINEARATLLHEMVHQWQAENDLPLDHGKVFAFWREVCRHITGLII
jgi:hypothetical protein